MKRKLIFGVNVMWVVGVDRFVFLVRWGLCRLLIIRDYLIVRKFYFKDLIEFRLGVSEGWTDICLDFLGLLG